MRTSAHATCSGRWRCEGGALESPLGDNDSNQCDGDHSDGSDDQHNLLDAALLLSLRSRIIRAVEPVGVVVAVEQSVWVAAIARVVVFGLAQQQDAQAQEAARPQ